ncbi:hypothetical protein [Anaerotignum lactatifermentans]|uniref:hypothetical protein n=1 Tax=Anaerotignum lactatifermentans TaxID=160404 RepID=UPI002622AE91|nr:hypothetical protein [Anaerotignum lactatifermentans]
MDILQSFLSLSDPLPPTFREIFRSAQELSSALGMKSYLLDHYLSLFFQMVSQIDFIVLQNEAQVAMGEMHHLFSDTSREASPKISAIMEKFSCQEASTKQNLCLISATDFIFEQSLLDFLAEKNSLFSAVDTIELQQTENKIRDHIGKEKVDAFQNILLRRFLPCSPIQLFSQTITTELVKRFLTRDLETDQEVFRLFLNHFHP